MAEQPLLVVRIGNDAEKAYARLRSVPVRAICKAMDIENQATISKIVKDRLSFPNTLPPQPNGLRVWTNRLRGSIRASKTVEHNGGFSSQIGTNVKYAAVHDLGYTGTQLVKQFMRRRYRYGKEKQVTFHSKWTGESVTLTRRSRRAIRGSEHSVRAHARYVHFPARMFLTGPIVERLVYYGYAIRKAIMDQWNKENPSMGNIWNG